MAERTILVSGASGGLGRQVVASLLARGHSDIIATTRTPEKLSDLAKSGVQVRMADYNQPDSLAEAFAGADILFLIPTHEIGARSSGLLKAIDAAKEAGVRHLFYISHPEADVSVSHVSHEHVIVEKAVRECGLTYTILRHFLYADVLLDLLPPDLEQDKIFGAIGDATISYVTRSDLAAADAGALLNASELENVTVDLTGARGYTNTELAAIVSDVLGRKVDYVDMSFDEYQDLLMSRGISQPIAEMLTSFQRSNAQGDFSNVNDLVARYSGREPQSLESFLKANLLAESNITTMDFILGGGHAVA